MSLHPSLDALQARVRSCFAAAFGGSPELVAQAPGRVNLIGEHTDYNDGFVLPCALDFRTLVAVRRRADTQVSICAADFPGQIDTFDLAQRPLQRSADAPWADYVRGVLAMFVARGLQPGGLEIAIAGDVPQGAGLSSSAALEVAVAEALRALGGWKRLSQTDLALIAQSAENQFVGCHCGIMDQLISACGRSGHALLIDCRSLQTQAVPMPDDLAVLIAHSRVRRGLVDSAYNTRRQQCETAARHFGVSALRDLDTAALQAGAPGLDPVVLARARYVVGENMRTLAAAQALASGDLAELGRLLAASHAAMRDAFEITAPAIDHLVDIAQQAIGADGGARMTGGGFGGCIVALLPRQRVDAVRAAIADQYRSPEGESAVVYVCRAEAGSGVLA